MSKRILTILAIIAAVLIAAFVARAAIWNSLQTIRDHLPRGDAWASIWTVILGLAFFVVLWLTTETKAVFLNYFLFALCGGAMGWVIGVLASPATAEEARTFGDYKTAIVGFVSGFAVTKINDLWRMLSEGDQPRVLNPGVLNRLLIFFGFFFLLVAQQYNTRQGHLGQIIVSGSVTQADKLVSQTQGALTVRPGAVINLWGAASFPDAHVTWSKDPKASPLGKAIALEGDTVTIPDYANLGGVGDKEKAVLVATSVYNKSREGTLEITLEKGDEPPTAPVSK